ncbi:multicopper oxidase family protein [Nannocystis radixulma]|uniref:Copper oxidase n=1 Tax=Nannocystis radixulma TaxID=2995305 RepID=A0ABT5BMU1_9BACT|nr:copper oxidase [Nannocystis radixulma]
MKDVKLSRRHALLASASIGGAATALASREVHAAAPVHKWESSYSGGAASAARTPGLPGRDYQPTVTPGGATLPWKIVDGVKVYHLVAEEVDHEFAPGLRALCWGYNGRVHGPTIEAVEGDRVRVYVTNKLPAPTTVHWHGIFLPNGMDGVGGLNQRSISPGETFRYEWTFKQSGTFMYHSHHDEMTQMALGMLGMIVVHPRPAPPGYRVDRDFVIMLSEWKIVPGAKRPDPNEMTDFNVLTMNAKAYPGTAPLVCRTGERVRIRFGNLSAMDHHPIHLHGYYWKVVATDGGPLPVSAQWPETTVLVPVGSTRDVEFVADAPGDWAMHCHMTHHVMNQMGHDLPNMIGVDARKVGALGGRVVPGYMPMGQHGMGDMAAMGMAVPKNSIPMVGARGPFDDITMGGMFTIVKVRDEDIGDGNQDPGWYKHPPGTVADLARKEDMDRDGIKA